VRASNEKLVRKERGMSNRLGLLQVSGAMCLVLTLGVSTNAGAGLFGFGGDSWQEEVLLHDGSTIIVERRVERGGRHEIGQKPPYKEQRLRFTMPGATHTVTWIDYYSDDLGQANFLPMALDIVGGTPYLVVHPMGCPSYNKWGRPNPPYVVFHYHEKEWKRIPLEQLPAAITTPNIIFSEPDAQVERFGTRVVTADMIKGLTEGYQQPEYRTLLRGPVKRDWPSKTSCSIPSTATGKLILPEIDGKPLYDNWWPLASEWLKSTYGKDR
jgi:hypothetical protein